MLLLLFNQLTYFFLYRLTDLNFFFFTSTVSDRVIYLKFFGGKKKQQHFSACWTCFGKEKNTYTKQNPFFFSFEFDRFYLPNKTHYLKMLLLKKKYRKHRSFSWNSGSVFRSPAAKVDGNNLFGEVEIERLLHSTVKKF